MNQNVCDKFRNISDPIRTLFLDCYTVSQKDNRIDAKLGTYKSLHFACSAVCSVTKTSNCFASMRLLHRYDTSPSLSTSRMHLIGHVIMNQCRNATFNKFITVGVLFVC